MLRQILMPQKKSVSWRKTYVFRGIGATVIRIDAYDEMGAWEKLAELAKYTDTSEYKIVDSIPYNYKQHEENS